MLCTALIAGQYVIWLFGLPIIYSARWQVEIFVLPAAKLKAINCRIYCFVAVNCGSSLIFSCQKQRTILLRNLVTPKMKKTPYFPMDKY